MKKCIVRTCSVLVLLVLLVPGWGCALVGMRGTYINPDTGEQVEVEFDEGEIEMPAETPSNQGRP